MGLEKKKKGQRQCQWILISKQIIEFVCWEHKCGWHQYHLNIDMGIVCDCAFRYVFILALHIDEPKISNDPPPVSTATQIMYIQMAVQSKTYLPGRYEIFNKFRRPDERDNRDESHSKKGAEPHILNLPLTLTTNGVADRFGCGAKRVHLYLYKESDGNALLIDDVQKEYWFRGRIGETVLGGTGKEIVWTDKIDSQNLVGRYPCTQYSVFIIYFAVSFVRLVLFLFHFFLFSFILCMPFSHSCCTLRMTTAGTRAECRTRMRDERAAGAEELTEKVGGGETYSTRSTIYTITKMCKHA